MYPSSLQARPLPNVCRAMVRSVSLRFAGIWLRSCESTLCINFRNGEVILPRNMRLPVGICICSLSWKEVFRLLIPRINLWIRKCALPHARYCGRDNPVRACHKSLSFIFEGKAFWNLSRDGDVMLFGTFTPVLNCGFLEEINLVWFISGGHTLKYPSPFE